MPDIRNLTKTRLVLPLGTESVVIAPEGKAHVPRINGPVIKAVENGLIEVIGAKRQKLAFPINDLLAHEAVAAIETIEDVDMLRDLLTDAKAKKVKDAINRRLKILEEVNGDDGQ